MEYYRAQQNVGVCLRLRQDINRSEGLVQNLHINMRHVRGSNYLISIIILLANYNDLIAMMRNLGLHNGDSNF